MNERRDYWRLHIDLPATYEIVGSGEEASTTILNISHSGLCIQSSSFIKKNTLVVLKFNLEYLGDMVLHAVVMWSGPEKGKKCAQNGVKITDKTDSTTRKRFVHFYEQKMLEPPKSEDVML
ncbi:MAG: PilZ domain-containing protein [Candidatus Omnitrophica bacterium]|nr:PilZ domain-containing protein [Candidatus Omnitrophota bacterium]